MRNFLAVALLVVAVALQATETPTAKEYVDAYFVTFPKNRNKVGDIKPGTLQDWVLRTTKGANFNDSPFKLPPWKDIVLALMDRVEQDDPGGSWNRWGGGHDAKDGEKVIIICYTCDMTDANGIKRVVHMRWDIKDKPNPAGWASVGLIGLDCTEYMKHSQFLEWANFPHYTIIKKDRSNLFEVPLKKEAAENSQQPEAAKVEQKTADNNAKKEAPEKARQTPAEPAATPCPTAPKSVTLKLDAPSAQEDNSGHEVQANSNAADAAKTIIRCAQEVHKTNTTFEESKAQLLKFIATITPQKFDEMDIKTGRTINGYDPQDKFRNIRGQAYNLIRNLGYEEGIHAVAKQEMLNEIPRYQEAKNKVKEPIPSVKKLLDTADAAIATIDTPADAKDKPTGAKVKPPIIVELNDGTKIECQKLMKKNTTSDKMTVKTITGELQEIKISDIKSKPNDW